MQEASELTDAPDPRVLLDRDDEAGIARITLNQPQRRNSYDATMRHQMAAYLDELAYDDAIKVVLLRGEGGVFSTGADMGNAYAWYGKGAKGPAGTGRSAAAAEPAPPARGRP